MPPIHMPFFFEAAILSRIRSPVTSRSNWAKDNSTLRVSRPIELVVLNCWVTDTNDTPWASKISTSRAKSASERVAGSGQYPALVTLAADVGLAGFALRLERVELLLEPFLGGFAGVDRAALPARVTPWHRRPPSSRRPEAKLAMADGPPIGFVS